MINPKTEYKTLNEVMEYLKNRTDKPLDYENMSTQMVGKIITKIQSNTRDKPHVTQFYPTYILIFGKDGKPYTIVHLEELTANGIKLKLYVKLGRMKYLVGLTPRYAKIGNNHVKITIKPGKKNYQGYDYFDYGIRDLEPAELAHLKAYKTTHKAVQEEVVEEEIVMADPSAFL